MPATPAAPRAFRLVCRPSERAGVEALLRAQGYVFEREPFSEWACRLHDGPRPLGASIAAFFGLIYIQDRSSMLPVLAANLHPGGRALTMLDVCASPGSKTGFAAQLAPPGSLIVANEPNRVRLGTLRRNMLTLNLAHVALTARPGEALPAFGRLFDRLLLDPPCSGWGTVGRHPGVTRLWQGERVAPLISLQRQLLRRAAPLLAPGGRLVYSTCTTNVAENEDQARFAADELGLVPAPLAPVPGFDLAGPDGADMSGVWRVRTSASEQGFFVAAFTKPGAAGTGSLAAEAANVPSGAAGPAGAAGTAEAIGPADAPKSGDAAWPGKNATIRAALAAAPAADEFFGASLDARLLGAGQLARFGDAIHFLPDAALSLMPPDLAWEGMAVGRARGKVARPGPRLRTLIRPDAPGLHLDEPQPIAALLSGQSLGIDPALAARAGGRPALFFQGVPLGLLSVKGSRALWSEA